MIIKTFAFILLVALSTAARDHLSITEYNSAIDATIRNIADPLYRQLPLSLNNFSYEIFPPRKPGDHPLLLIRYNPPRFNVVLNNVHLNSIASINREGDCLIPDKDKPWEVNCWYKFKNVKFTAEGKQGQRFNEDLDITMVVASYKWRSPNEKGQIWHLWAPWAPGSVEFKPMVTGNLSTELKKYLDENNEDMKRFLEYVVSEVEDKFLDYTKMTDSFNRVLKEQNLDENSPTTRDAPTFYTTSYQHNPPGGFRSASQPRGVPNNRDTPITAVYYMEPVPYFYDQYVPQSIPAYAPILNYQRAPSRNDPIQRAPSRGYDTQSDYFYPRNQFFRQGKGSKPQYYAVKY